MQKLAAHGRKHGSAARQGSTVKSVACMDDHVHEAQQLHAVDTWCTMLHALHARTFPRSPISSLCSCRRCI